MYYTLILMYYNDEHSILRIFDALLILFFSPQVKRSKIIGYKHGIYELPNDLRLSIIGS